ncbi:hypothetical protein C8Q75DRAFT_367719 [Abortiporus biennis]|nr:hypothetical protein C8Q75DRAFT_367719 [Abortiporus biennis]
MRVLLLGATGFIGLPVAQALVRAGHIVHGLTHNPAKAKQLQADEVIPIVGDYLNPAEWLTPSLVAKLDVVINVVSIELRIKDPESDSRIIKLLVELAQQSRPTYAPKLSFIYTTGVMLYGQDPREVVNDTTAISPDKLPEFVKAVPNFEQQVLKNPVLNSIIIRPGLVYGRSGSLTANLFSQAKEGNTIKHFGVEGWRAVTVHTDDLANLYLLAAEKAQLVAGNIFANVNDATESMDDILGNLVAISGAKGYEYTKPSNVWESSFASTRILRPYLGRTLLGWRPSRRALSIICRFISTLGRLPSDCT